MILLAALAAAAELPREWRLDLVIATRAELPVLGAVRAEGRSVLAVRLEPDGAGWLQSQDVCTSEVREAGLLVRTVLPDAFVAALPDAEFPVALEAEPGGAYVAAFGPQPVGWSGLGAFPVDAADPRILDWEDDGNPGATVLVEAPFVGTGEVYVIQSGETRLRGKLDADGVIRGKVEVVGYANRVVGASSRMLLHGPAVTPDPARSWFELRPAPGFSCETLGAAP